MNTKRRNLKSCLFWLAGVILFAAGSAVEAADRAAASCSAADIQSAINQCLASGGGTVTLPACDFSNRWSSADTIYADVGSTELRIVGQGTSSTKIGYADNQGLPAEKAMWEFSGSGLKEFANIYLEGNPTIDVNAVGVAFVVRFATDCRIHHIETRNFRGPTAMICSSRNLVIDRCTFGDVLYNTYYQFYVYDTANVPWLDAWPANFGSANYNIFFEDNIIGGAHHPVSLFERAKVVFRYNTVTIPASSYGPAAGYQGNLDSHSPGFGSCDGDGIPDDQSYQHGGQAYEIYNNRFLRTDVSPPNSEGYGVRLRSGAAIVANNTFENVAYPVALVLENNNIGGNCTAANGYPQDHQFGPGKAACTAGDGCCDKIQHIYVWGNTSTNFLKQIQIEDESPGGGLVQNKDYFLREPTSAQDGFSWLPYRYPHPLISNIGAPNPPTQVSVEKEP
jgi:hypothetical protein